MNAVTITAPSAPAEGDLLLVGFFCAPAPAPPSGWTLAQSAGGSGASLYIFTRIAGVSEPSSWTFDFASAPSGAAYYQESNGAGIVASSSMSL